MSQVTGLELIAQKLKPDWKDKNTRNQYDEEIWEQERIRKRSTHTTRWEGEVIG